MTEMRKITVEVRPTFCSRPKISPGVTDVVRTALKKLASMRAPREFLKLRGTYKFNIDLDELRDDRE